MTPRTRSILLAFLVAGGAVGIAAAVYLFSLNRRLWSEIGGRPWQNPTGIYSADGTHVLDVYGAEWRTTTPVVLEELPPHVPAAFLAAEDERFRRHFGIDPAGVLRAVFANVRAGGIAQGGSTITQQLVKMKVLSAERSWSRKVPEAILAVGLELRVSKDDILEAYLNDVYLGHVDGHAVQGITEASKLYFDKRPETLTAGDAALLAAMVRAPNRDHPEKRPEVVRARRDAILRIMLRKRWIDDAAYQSSLREAVRLDPGRLPPRPYQYYLDGMRAEAIEHVGERRLTRGGLKVHAGLDPLLQIAAEKAAHEGTRYLARRHSWIGRADQPLQAGIFSVDPRSGVVRAVVGGAEYRLSKLDRTRLMRRQPGSTFKPFVYLAAIDSREFTAASPLRDDPLEVKLARNDVWRPQNFDERFRGEVTLREAFEKSLNVPAVRVAEKLGKRSVHRVVSRFKFDGELSETPALALGVSEVSIRELTAAYTIFPSLGLRSEPHFIERVETRSGRRVYEYKGKGARIVDAPVAYVLHTLLRGVVSRGTASKLGEIGFDEVGGKTGTTNDYRDAWFVGYTPELLTTVWVGFDESLPLRLSSAESAVPIWAETMRVRAAPEGDMPVPEGVTVVAIDPASGRRWRPGCGRGFDEVFLTGTEPVEPCGGRRGSSVLARFEEPAVIRTEPRDDESASRWIRTKGKEKERFRRLSRDERERLTRGRRSRPSGDDAQERYEVILQRRAEEMREEMKEWQKARRKSPKKPKSRDRHDDDEDDEDDEDD